MKHILKNNQRHLMGKLFALILFLGVNTALQAQVNDLCQSATNLGTPALNQQICTAGTTVGANPEFPYITLTGCSGNTPASPTSAADVWYRFVLPAGANQLQVDLTSAMAGSAIAVFSGTCGNFGLAGCANDNGSGNLTVLISPMTQNSTYYIRVSGNNVNDQAAFNLCITPLEETGICVSQSTFTSNPTPIGGAYYPGDVVTFCYTVTEWTQIQVNWFHGIAIQYGTGWVPGSLTAVSSPTSCDGSGVWGFYNQITGSNGTGNFGPGFFYDTPNGSVTGIIDGNPGNNWGDDCTQGNWQFCFRLTVSQPPAGSCGSGNPALDLSLQILQYGDSETGGWGFPACASDPPLNFPVVISCCAQPSFTITDVDCSTGCAGQIIASGNGQAPFTYAWATGDTGTTISNLCAGAYNVTVTDSTGCQVVSTAVVQLIGGLGTTSGKADVTCANAGNGKAWVTPTNGVGPYTYTWNTTPSQSTDTAFNLVPGTYRVIVNDVGGCIDTVTYTITQPNPLRGTLFSSPTGCGPIGTGKAWAITSGGTAPYTFAWNTTPVQNNDTAFGLTAGTYTITITDANGCISTRPVVVGSSTGITATAAFSATCAGSTTGKAWGIPNGGSGPYTYQWNTTPVQNTDTAINLAAGPYTVTVTDAGGCSATASVTVTSLAALNLTTGSKATSCNGGADGKAWVRLIGGSAPISYTWNTTPVQNTDTAFNLIAGIYNVTVTNGNGCTSTTSVQVTDATPLVINMFADSIGCFGANNANVWAVVSGSNAPYSYTWSTGTQVPTGDTITNVTAGTYYLTVVDAKGCTDSSSITVLQQANLSLTGGTDSVSCTGLVDGKAWVAASGGLAPFTYRWSTAPQQTSDTARNLRANVYTVTVTDDNGCQDFLVLTVGEPPAIAIAMDADSVTCNGTATGVAWATPSGGIGAYTYAWSGGGGFGLTPDTVNTLIAGVYNVIVTDGINCTATNSIQVFEPTALVANAFADSVRCNGANTGVARVVATGGTLPYTYIWSGGTQTVSGDSIINLSAGTYSVTVRDFKNCEVVITGITVGEPAALALSAIADSVNCAGGNDGSIDLTVSGGSLPYSYLWSNAATTQDITGLGVGGYIPTVTDAKGCTATLPAIQIFAPSALATVTGNDSVSCNGTNDGKAYVGVTGGTPGYIYVWNSLPVQNTDTAFGVPVGTYTVVITDAHGCTTTDATTVGKAGGLMLTAGVDSVSCNGGNDGKAWATATGGSGSGYAYTWNTSPAQNTDTISGLIAGSYTVTASDGNSCSLTATVIVGQPAGMTLSSSATDVTCNSGSDGSATVTVTGGSAPYSYNWSDVGTNGSTNPSIVGVSAGSYDVVVNDANSCADSITGIAVTEPTAINLSIASTDALCANAATGTIRVTVSGGSPGYNFAWTNGLTGQNPNNVLAGTYRVTVGDANSCSDTISTTVNEPVGFTVSSQVTNVSCFGLNDGAVDITVSGASAPYTYSWSTSGVNTTEDIIGLTAGRVTVTISDANGCDTSLSYTITQPNELLVAIATNLSNFSCTNNVLSGTVTSSVTGGLGPFGYSWSNGDVTQNTTNVNVPSYQVTVTDANGCTAESQVIINPVEPLTANIVVDSAACFGDANGQAEVFVSGGIEQFQGYDFNWVGITNPTVGSRNLNLPAGDYSVIVTDSLGCDTTILFTITEQPEMTVDAGPDLTVIYESDSVIVSTVTGLRPTDNVFYNWTPNEALDCNDCTDPIVTPTRDLIYIVEVDVNGCVYTDTVAVFVAFEDKVYYAPNAFSPNGDGLNDIYQIYTKGARKIYWTIFNRWGEEVFLSRSLTDGWDGTLNGNPANQGVYVLHVFIQYQDGTSQRKSQSILLMR